MQAAQNTIFISLAGPLRTQPNLKKTDLHVLNNIQTQIDTIICPVVENGGIVTTNAAGYIAEVCRHLDNTDIYLPPDHDPTSDL